jgi:hypothetical protein
MRVAFEISFKDICMKKFTKSLVALALGVSSLTVNADTVSAGGVTWDSLPTTPSFNASLEFTQWFTTDNTTTMTDYNGSVDVGGVVNPTGVTTEELVGVGEILAINSAPFCGSCELTFSFGGIFADGTGDFDFDSGWINVYVDTPVSTNFQNTSLASSWGTPGLQGDIDNAVDGDLWLSLSVEDGTYSETSGYVSGNISLNMNAEDGLASDIFDSNNTFGFDIFSNELFDAVGSSLGASFTEFRNGVYISTTSTGSIIANPVSTPASLGLFGGALILLGASVRRKTK